MKRYLISLFSTVSLFAAVLCFSGCNLLSNNDKNPETYTVTFNANAGTDTVTSLPSALTGIESGVKITAPSAVPVRNGYTFNGWYKENACSTKWDFASDTVTSSITLFAGWEAAGKTYTVTFDANAGTDTVTSLSSALTAAEGAKITAPSAVPVRSGYTFNGWYKENACSTKWDFASDTVTSSITLFAGWVTEGVSYTVTFNANNTDSVTGLPASVTEISPNSAVTEPSAPSCTGCTFGGWYKEKSCTTKWNFSSDTVSEDTTLYACWLCTITFDTGESGWVCPPLTAKKGASVDLETYYMTQISIYSATDPDYGVADIFTDSGYTHSAADTYTLNESRKFYFKMVKLFPVTIYPNGGKFLDSSTTAKTVKVMPGRTVASIDMYIAKPTRDGYVFSCWCSDEEGMTEISVDTKIESALTLYAQWSKPETGIKGWWLYTNVSGGKCFMNLDPASGTGVMYDESVERNALMKLTVTGTKITVDSDHSYSYTYTSDTAVLTFNGITCSRPSEMKTAGGTAGGTYLTMNSLLLLNTSDNTCTLTSTDDTSVSVSGKWSSDGSSFYLLDDESKLITQLPDVKKLDYDTFGGYYYNYDGSADYDKKDAWSLYLGKDGTYHYYVFDLDIQGTWYASASGTDTDIYLSGGYGNSYINSVEYNGTGFKLPDSTGTIIAQSASKERVAGFSEDTELTGTWIYTVSNTTQQFTFTADGTEKIYITNGLSEQSMNYYYYADKEKGMIYSLAGTMPFMLQGINGTSSYSISSDGTELKIISGGQTGIFTKK